MDIPTLILFSIACIIVMLSNLNNKNEPFN